LKYINADVRQEVQLLLLYSVDLFCRNQLCWPRRGQALCLCCQWHCQQESWKEKDKFVLQL